MIEARERSISRWSREKEPYDQGDINDTIGLKAGRRRVGAIGSVT